jgi:hypothetical protein
LVCFFLFLFLFVSFFLFAVYMLSLSHCCRPVLLYDSLAEARDKRTPMELPYFLYDVTFISEI